MTCEATVAIQKEMVNVIAIVDFTWLGINELCPATGVQGRERPAQQWMRLVVFGQRRGLWGRHAYAWLATWLAANGTTPNATKLSLDLRAFVVLRTQVGYRTHLRRRVIVVELGRVVGILVRSIDNRSDILELILDLMDDELIINKGVVVESVEVLITDTKDG
jgi:hypothetical protein